MKRRHWFMFVTMAAVLSILFNREYIMANQKVGLNLTPFKFANIAAIISIRLISKEGNISIAALENSKEGKYPVSTIQFNGTNVSNQQSSLLVSLDSYFGVPAWDIVNKSDGIAVVWTKPGSAISSLGFKRTGGEELNLTKEYSMGVFQNPRFVKDSDSIAITAIASEEEGNIVALFQKEIESGHSRYVALPSTGSGIILDGLLLKLGSGYLLISKYYTSNQSGAERMDLRGESIGPGILHCVLLDDMFVPVGKVINPVNDTTVFEFDADVLGNNVFLFATTNDGYISAKGVISENGLFWNNTHRIAIPNNLTAPSVLATEKEAFATVIESSGSCAKQILAGKFAN